MATKLIKGYAVSQEDIDKNTSMGMTMLNDLDVSTVIIIPAQAEGGKSDPKGYSWFKGILPTGGATCIGAHEFPKGTMKKQSNKMFQPIECKLRVVSPGKLELYED